MNLPKEDGGQIVCLHQHGAKEQAGLPFLKQAGKPLGIRASLLLLTELTHS